MVKSPGVAAFTWRCGLRLPLALPRAAILPVPASKSKKTLASFARFKRNCEQYNTLGGRDLHALRQKHGQQQQHVMEEVPFYYQPVDPVHNLRVRVTIRQVRGEYEGGGKAASADSSSAANPDDTNASMRSDGPADHDGRQWSATFGWQEKEFGPREVRKYWPSSASASGGGSSSSRRRGRGGSNGAASPRGGAGGGRRDVAVAAAAYEAQLAAEAGSGKTPFDVLYAGEGGGRPGVEVEGEGAESVKLFTYVDKDGFVPCSEIRRTVSTSGAAPTALAGDVLSLRGVTTPGGGAGAGGGGGDGGGGGGGSAGPTGGGAPRHLRKAAGCKSFFVMAAVDMDAETVDAMRDPEQWPGGGGGGGGGGGRKGGGRGAGGKPIYEKTLCCVRWYPQGVLSVTPGFSDDVAEDAAQQAQAMSLAASGHGGAADSNPHLLPPRIQSFTFTTPAGSTYEYTVENAAELADMDDEAKLTRADEAVAAAEASRWRLLTGTAFGGAPPAGHTRVFVNAEIVSGARFDGDALYAKYEVTLPPDGGWQWAADQGGGDSAGGGMGHGDGSTPSSSSAAAAATDGGGEGHGGHGIGAAAPTHRGFTTRCTVRGISQQAATSYTHPAGYRRGEELPDADGIFADPTDATEVRKEERKTGSADRTAVRSCARGCLSAALTHPAPRLPARPLPFALCPLPACVTCSPWRTSVCRWSSRCCGATATAMTPWPAPARRSSSCRSAAATRGTGTAWRASAFSRSPPRRACTRRWCARGACCRRCATSSATSSSAASGRSTTCSRRPSRWATRDPSCPSTACARSPRAACACA